MRLIQCFISFSFQRLGLIGLLNMDAMVPLWGERFIAARYRFVSDCFNGKTDRKSMRLGLYPAKVHQKKPTNNAPRLCGNGSIKSVSCDWSGWQSDAGNQFRLETIWRDTSNAAVWRSKSMRHYCKYFL
jgi:hypothetical protein